MALVQKSFSDIITFSRSSNATRVGPTGLVEYAPHNLLVRSQEFDNASWTKNQANVSANVATAPDGTVTADKLFDDSTASNVHRLVQTFTVVNDTRYTLSVYAKAAERTFIVLQLALGFASTPSAYFNLSTGTVGTTTGSPSATITSVGNGWYRCTITAVANSTGAGAQPYIYLASADNTVVYTGDGTSGVYLWGAQLSVGPYALDYTPTTSAAVYGPRFDYDGSGVTIVEPVSANQFLYSEQFDNAWWTKGNASITANASVAPDGTTTADKLVENSSNAFHYVGRTSLSVSAQAYTVSFYAKAAERTRCFLDFNDGVTGATAYFDLSNGTSSNVSALLTVSITSVGNGWYRITASRVYASATSGAQFTIAPTIAAGTTTYLGDGSSGILIWGAQLEVGSTATGYMASGATNGFRAVPVVSGSATAKGLLVEEQRTNLLTYSEDFTAWPVSGGTVLGNQATAPDGTVTADLFYPLSSGDFKAVYKAVIGAGISVWSVFAKAAGKNWISVINFAGNTSIAWFNLQNGTVGTVAAGYTATIQSFGNGWYRCSVYYASGTFNYTQVNVVNGNNTSTVTANGTDGIYLWGAQGESGAFSTSYIPTLASTVTRSADVASVNTLSPFYNAVEGTLFAELSGLLSTSYFQAPAYNFGDSNNRIELRAVGNPFTYNRAVVTTAGVTQVDFESTGLSSSASTPRKVALAYKLNDFATVGTGGTVGTDTSGTIPTVSVLNIGTAPYDSSIKTNGWIARIAYYPRRLTNAELQALTA